MFRNVHKQTLLFTTPVAVSSRYAVVVELDPLSPLDTASNAYSSASNTLAFPVNLVISIPAVLITAPSGAKVPFSITAVPTLCNGFSMDLTIFSSDVFNILMSGSTTHAYCQVKRD